MKKAINIQSLIYRNYLTSSLVPIFTIEVLLIVLYFSINFYMLDKSEEILLKDTTRDLHEITSREAAIINKRLKGVSQYAELIQRNQTAFFANDKACFIPYLDPEFSIHKNGAYHKVNNIGGASLYYSSSTIINEEEKRKAHCSEMLDPLMVSIVDTSRIVTQAYLNTWDGMNRLYPFMVDAPKQYGPVLQMQKFNFYYEADV